METSELIKGLGRDLRPTKEGDTLALFLFKWFVCSAVLVVVSLSFVSLRPDLAVESRDPHFYFISVFWFASSLLLAILVYQSSIPGILRRVKPVWAYTPLMLIGAMVLSRFPSHGIRAEAMNELDFLQRGRCGAMIGITGVIAATLFYGWARRSAAPTQPRFTAIGVALSAGCLASFIMEFICPYETALHVMIWHFTPVVALTWLGAVFGRKVLQW